jgi:hypothetical protein
MLNKKFVINEKGIINLFFRIYFQNIFLGGEDFRKISCVNWDIVC